MDKQNISFYQLGPKINKPNQTYLTIKPNLLQTKANVPTTKSCLLIIKPKLLATKPKLLTSAADLDPVGSGLFGHPNPDPDSVK